MGLLAPGLSCRNRRSFTIIWENSTTLTFPPRLRLLPCAIRAFFNWRQIRLADGSLFVQTTSAFVQCAKSNDFAASTQTPEPQIHSARRHRGRPDRKSTRL